MPDEGDTSYDVPGSADTMVSFRLPADVLAAVERAAKDEDRSRSSWMLRVLRERLVRQGYLPPVETPRAAANRAGREEG